MMSNVWTSPLNGSAGSKESILSHFAIAEHCWNVAPRRPADFQRRVVTVRAPAERKERSRVGSLFRDFCTLALWPSWLNALTVLPGTNLTCVRGTATGRDKISPECEKTI